VSTILRQTPPVGFGSTNFVTEILDIYASLDLDRKERLIDFSGRLGEEQRADDLVRALR